MWPVLVLATPPRRLPAVWAALALASASARMAAGAAGAPPEALHRLTIFRLDALALVASLAVSTEGRRTLRRRLPAVAALSALALVVLLVAGRSATSSAMTGPGYTVLAVVDACLVFAAFDRTGSPGRACWLRRPWLRTLGKYSYAIYVFHYPISLEASRVAAVASRGLSGGGRTGVWLVSVTGGIAASCLVAFLSWHLVEKPFLSLKASFVARPARVSS